MRYVFGRCSQFVFVAAWHCQRESRVAACCRCWSTSCIGYLSSFHKDVEVHPALVVESILSLGGIHLTNEPQPDQAREREQARVVIIVFCLCAKWCESLLLSWLSSLFLRLCAQNPRYPPCNDDIGSLQHQRCWNLVLYHTMALLPSSFTAPSYWNIEGVVLNTTPRGKFVPSKLLSSLDYIGLLFFAL